MTDFIYYFLIAGIFFFLGFGLGYKFKVTKMDGDLCIATDEDGDYIFLRLNEPVDNLKKQHLVELKVTMNATRD